MKTRIWSPPSVPAAPTAVLELERQHRRERSACGCREGFLGLVAGLALSGRNYIAAQGADSSLSRTIFTGIAFGLCGAVAGKSLGLAWAHFRRSTHRR
jgi:hypothetical protein